MSETVTISRDELDNLEQRVKNLAEDKSYLQLVIHLMNQISATPGLESTIDNMLKCILDVIGATNIVLYYQIDESLFSADVYGNNASLEQLDDPLVKRVFDIRQPVEEEHAFVDTRMLTDEFTRAYTWAFPLMVGTELIGVVRMENLHLGMQGLARHLPTFFHYAALILKNEILGHTRLQQAYERVSRANSDLTKEITERKRAEEQIRQLNAHLEKRVARRTAELRNANRKLEVELAERTQIQDRLRESERRLRAIFDHTVQFIGLLTPDGTLIEANRGALELAGSRGSDVLGRLFWKTPWWQHSEEMQEKVRSSVQSASEGQFIRFEATHPTPNGDLVYVDFSLTPVWDDTGHVVLLIPEGRDITERKLAEQSHRRLALIVESSDDAIISKTLDGTVLTWNAGAERLYGYSAEEAIGSSVSVLVPPECPDELPQILERIRRGERVAHYETTRISKDGRRMQISLCVSPLTDKHGNVTGASTIARDITDRKRHEALLAVRCRLSESAAARSCDELLQSVLDEAETLTASRIGFFHFLADDQVTIMLQTWSTNTLQSMCTAEGKGLHYPVEQAGVWVDCIRERRPVIHNDYASLPHRRGLPAGHAPLVRELVVPVVREGKIAAILGVGNKESDYVPADVETVARLADLAWDIVVRKRAEEALAESEKRFRDLYENAPNAYFSVGLDGVIRNCNKRAGELLGYAVEELVGRPVMDLYAESAFGHEKAAPVLERFRAGETVRDEELEMRKADGNSVWISLTVDAARDAEGTVAESRSMVVDITERKRAENERLAHFTFLESLDQVNRAIQRTNDLQQMMSGVLGAVLTIFDCDRAWLFYPCDPDAPSFRVPMEITRPEYPGAGILNADVPMPSEMAHDLREALQSADPISYTAGTDRPINRVSAEQFGVKSQVMAALYPKSGKPWVFGLHQCSYPRVWTPEEKRLLQEIGWRLADGLTSLLMLRNLRESEGRLEEAQRIAHVGHWDHYLDTDRIIASDETLRIFGQPPDEHTIDFTRFLELLHPEDRQRVAQTVKAAFRGGRSYHVEYRVLRPTGELRFVHAHVTSEEGGPTGHLFGTVQDVTERRQAEESLRVSLAEKDVLVREVHHRVKNNLAAVVGLIDMQARTMDGTSAKAAVKDLAGRIRSMAMVHEQLYRSESLSRIDLQVYVEALTSDLRASFGSPNPIRFSVAAEGIQMGLDLAIPCGLIVTELVTNAMKHAFPEGRPGLDADVCEITISAQRKDAICTLAVADNGVGLPTGLDVTTTNTLGLRLVRMLGEHQLGGKIELDGSRGTRFVLRFNFSRTE